MRFRVVGVGRGGNLLRHERRFPAELVGVGVPLLNCSRSYVDDSDTLTYFPYIAEDFGVLDSAELFVDGCERTADIGVG